MTGVDVISFGVANATEIERSVATFASSPNSGLILTASTLSVTYSDLVIALAAGYKLPAINTGSLVRRALIGLWARSA
jgi:hypothetical protein